jgi:hypothetical protein
VADSDRSAASGAASSPRPASASEPVRAASASSARSSSSCGVRAAVALEGLSGRGEAAA